MRPHGPRLGLSLAERPTRSDLCRKDISGRHGAEPGWWLRWGAGSAQVRQESKGTRAEVCEDCGTDRRRGSSGQLGLGGVHERDLTCEGEATRAWDVLQSRWSEGRLGLFLAAPCSSVTSLTRD